MRRIAAWLSGTAAALVVLLSFPTSHGASGTSNRVVAAGTTGSTVTGEAVSSRYGPVQVTLVVQDGKVVSATASGYRTSGRDGQINSWAIPQLQEETVSAPSDQIDTVSGATFTSEAYIGSLQSALDQAGLT